MLLRTIGCAFFLFIGLQNAAAQLCEHTGEYATVCLRSYNQIEDWNPCAFHEWAVAHKTDRQLGDWFDSPFFDYSAVSPGRPIDLYTDMCNDAKEPKPDWELFNRSLLESDWPGVEFGEALAKMSAYSEAPIQTNVTPAPYFAMYKKSSGLLRFFFWINGALSLSAGEDLVVESSFYNNSLDAAYRRVEDTDNHGYSMSDIENGYTFATALSQVSLYRESVKSQVYPRAKSSNFWLVVDKYVSYDPWATDAYGDKKEMTLDVVMRTVERSTIQLDGTIKEDFSSDVQGGVGIFKEYPFAGTAVSKLVSYGQGYLDKHSGSIAKSIVDFAEEEATGSSTKPGAEETRELLLDWRNAMNQWDQDVQSQSGVLSKATTQTNSGLIGNVVEKGLDLAVSQGSGWVGSAIIDGLLGTTVRYKQEIVSLNGTLTTPHTLGNTGIPISSTIKNEKSWPYYYRKNADGKPAHENNLGVFNFKAPPKMHLTMTECKFHASAPRGGCLWQHSLISTKC